MRYNDLKPIFQEYHAQRSLFQWTMGKLEFQAWNHEMKRTLAALIAIWQRSGGLL